LVTCVVVFAAKELDGVLSHGKLQVSI
jgi:hypothetical protein